MASEECGVNNDDGDDDCEEDGIGMVLDDNEEGCEASIIGCDRGRTAKTTTKTTDGNTAACKAKTTNMTAVLTAAAAAVKTAAPTPQCRTPETAPMSPPLPPLRRSELELSRERHLVRRRRSIGRPARRDFSLGASAAAATTLTTTDDKDDGGCEHDVGLDIDSVAARSGDCGGGGKRSGWTDVFRAPPPLAPDAALRRLSLTTCRKPAEAAAAAAAEAAAAAAEADRGASCDQTWTTARRLAYAATRLDGRSDLDPGGGVVNVGAGEGSGTGKSPKETQTLEGASGGGSGGGGGGGSGKGERGSAPTKREDEPRRRMLSRAQATRLRRRLQGIAAADDDDDENDATDGPPKEPIRPADCPPIHTHRLVRDDVLHALSAVMARGTLVRLDLSQRGLVPSDARLLAETLFRNPALSTMKLGFNRLGDEGAAMLAAAIKRSAEAAAAFAVASMGGGESGHDGIGAAALPNVAGAATAANAAATTTTTSTHHRSLSELDLGFNDVGDGGCRALAEWAVVGNATLRTLYLSGNNIRKKGALTLAAALVNGGQAGLRSIHMASNQIGSYGTRALTRAVAEVEARRVALLAAEAAASSAAASAASSVASAGGQEADIAAAAAAAAESVVSSGAELYGALRKNGIDVGAIAAAGGGADRMGTVYELHLGGTGMCPDGCLSVSNMLLTNFALRVLSLANCNVDDRDLALFSQALTRNKRVPLETIDLSRNRLTCAGVESLMNAVWGSPTLRTIRLDNNKIKDRGAQLCAVVLTSVRLEALDLGFNKVTTAGIKTLMKSLAENDGLAALSLSGIALDNNSAKAISYALAYNSSLVAFGADNCSLSYSAQRHIAAGIVSNPNLKLRKLTGFRIGAVAATLGLPPELEKWNNSKALSFMRYMWERRRREEEGKNMHVAMVETTMNGGAVPGAYGAAERRAGPADPGTVVSAAKAAHVDFDGADERELAPHEDGARAINADGCPVAADSAILLERTPSGTLLVPPFLIPTEAEGLRAGAELLRRPMSAVADRPNGLGAVPSLCTSLGAVELSMAVPEPTRRKRIIEWLNVHLKSLNEIAHLPFNGADLRLLYQHYYSPIEDVSSTLSGNSLTSMGLHKANGSSNTLLAQSSTKFDRWEGKMAPSSSNADPDAAIYMHSDSTPQDVECNFDGKQSSFQYLSDAASSNSVAADSVASRVGETGRLSRSRRRSVEMTQDSGSEGIRPLQPACKRARSNKPRISYYPRLRKKLEEYGEKANQYQTLVLMRRLKFMEEAFFQGRSACSAAGAEAEPDQPNISDVEVILLDML